jgi:MFS family permease
MDGRERSDAQSCYPDARPRAGHREIAIEILMEEADEARPSKRSETGLDWLNFFIADVQTGFGPFVAVYLASLNWSPSHIGLLLTVSTLASIASQVPGGALVDAVPSKQLLIAGALATVALGALLFAFFPNPVIVFFAAMLYGSTGGVIKPALSAIGLGLVGRSAFSARIGRNQRYNSLGNAATASLIGILAHFMGQRAPFLIAAGLCVPAAGALAGIRSSEIDYARARSARDRKKPRESAQLRDIFKSRPLLVFTVVLVLFQLADASVMPLASGRLGYDHNEQSELITALLVAIPEIVTVFMAGWIARQADNWGRKPLLVAGFCVLPLRAVLFALAPGPWYLLGIQALSGITAATMGIMMPLVIADITRGTGRYNLAQGAAGTASAIGASLSTAVSGYVAQLFGYNLGFVGLAAIGAIGLILLCWFLPETNEPSQSAPPLTKELKRLA